MLDNFVRDIVAPGLGVTFPDYVLIVYLIILFIFFAVDIRIGLVISFVATALLYVGFTAIGWPTLNIITVFFAIIVLLALSLFISKRRTGGQII